LDPELLAKCRKGDPEAIETLVNEHQARLYRLCLSILDSPDDAQDAVQETFIAAIRALPKYRGDAALQTWLYSIAVNACRGQMRQSKRRGKYEGPEDDAEMTTDRSKPSLEGSVIASQHADAIWEAVSSLDEKHRLPVILRYYHEMSTEEIARVLNINLGTVHSRLSNARTRLTGELKRANISLAGGEQA
jgi:RNA polymerase sigma-70 factor (ECF subfamily)